MDFPTNNNITVANRNFNSSPNSFNLTNADDKRTLEKLGGIRCDHCEDTFDDRKRFDHHHATRHEHASLLYKCIQCSKTFPKYKTFHDHCYRHVSGKRFRCDQCRKQFSQGGYILHMQTFHLEVKRTEGQLYPCSQCSRHYDSFKLLAQHLRHCNRDRPYTCSICNKNFTEKSFLLRHLPYHSETKNFKCKSCNSSFKTKRSLSVHSRMHLENRTLNYECKYCQKRFLTSTKLAFHMNTHSGDRPYRCDHCDLTFTNNPNRIKHMRQHNTKKQDLCGHRDLVLIGKFIKTNPMEKQIIDEHQGNFEQTSGEINDHIKIHGTLHTGDGLKQFCCEYCPERFPYRRSWLRHMKRRHIQYKYYCNTCNKTILCSNPIYFVCDYCMNGFTEKSNLLRHMLHMHMQCKYRCTVCRKAFISSKDLESHFKKHNTSSEAERVTRIASVVALPGSTRKHLIKEFSCQYCQKDFTYSRSCMRHMKREHDHKIEKKQLKIIETERQLLPKYEEIKFNIESSTFKEGLGNTCDNVEATTVSVSHSPPVSNEASNAPSFHPYAFPVPVSQPYLILVPNEVNTKEGPAKRVSHIVTELNKPDAVSSVEKNQAAEEENTKTVEIDEELLNFIDTIFGDDKLHERGLTAFSEFSREAKHLENLPSQFPIPNEPSLDAEMIGDSIIFHLDNPKSNGPNPHPFTANTVQIEEHLNEATNFPELFDKTECLKLFDKTKCANNSMQNEPVQRTVALHNSLIFNLEHGYNSEPLHKNKVQTEDQVESSKIIENFISFQFGAKETTNVDAAIQSTPHLELVPSTKQLEPVEKDFVSPTPELREYGQDFHTIHNDNPEVWTAPEPDQGFADIFSWGDESILPHIDPRLTIRDSDYKEHVIQNLFPNVIENEIIPSCKDDIYSLKDVNSLLNDATDKLRLPADYSGEFVKESTNGNIRDKNYTHTVMANANTGCSPDGIGNSKDCDPKSSIVKINYSHIDGKAEKNYSNLLSMMYANDERNECSPKTAAVGDNSYCILHRWISTLQA